MIDKTFRKIKRIIIEMIDYETAVDRSEQIQI